MSLEDIRIIERTGSADNERQQLNSTIEAIKELISGVQEDILQIGPDDAPGQDGEVTPTDLVATDPVDGYYTVFDAANNAFIWQLIDASDVISGTFDDARIAESNVTQHEPALNHDALLNFEAAEHINWAITGAEDIHVDRVTAAAVTQHQAALTILETQITDGALLARLASNEPITGLWTFPDTTATDPDARPATKSYVDAVPYEPFTIPEVNTAAQSREVDFSNGPVQTIGTNDSFTLTAVGPAGRFTETNLYIYNFGGATITPTLGTGFVGEPIKTLPSGETEIVVIRWDGVQAVSFNSMDISGDVRPSSFILDLSSISPTSGDEAGGTTVTATGTFDTGSAISFTVGGVAATSPTVVNATTATFVTPAGTGASNDVVATQGAQTDTLVGAFEYTATAWTPANTTTNLWLDADDTDTITLSGSNVSQIDDKSGNLNHATPVGAESGPVLDSGTLLYSGSSSRLSSPSDVNIADEYVFIVGNANALDAWFTAHRSGGASNDRFYARSSDYFVGAGSMSFAADEQDWAIFELKADGSTKTGYLNAALVSSFSDANTFTHPDTFVGGGENPNPIYLDGRIAEYIKVPTSISTADVEKMQGYLAHKWDGILGVTTLVDALPASHPYKSAAPTLGDPYFAEVESLIHFDGTDGSTTITDEKGVTWTAQGAAQLDTAEQKFGTASLLQAAVGDHLTTTAGAGTWADFSTAGDFTVEMWINASKVPDRSALFAHKFSSSDFPLCVAFGKVGTVSTTPELYVGHYNGTWQGANSTWQATVGVWHHIVAERVGTVVTLYADGVSIASYDQSSSPPDPPGLAEFRLGKRWDITGESAFHGHIDDWRVTRGTARYQGSFTPPTAPFPDE